jgi:hypothetical protein
MMLFLLFLCLVQAVDIFVHFKDERSALKAIESFASNEDIEVRRSWIDRTATIWKLSGENVDSIIEILRNNNDVETVEEATIFHPTQK